MAARLPTSFRIFHGLRHHFAVTLANSGEFTLDMIGELLTHTSTAMAKVLSRLATVRAGSMGDCKSLDGGLYELRIDFGPGYRVYFGQDGQTLVILLCGGDKSSQTKDISKARDLWAAYKEEKHEPCS